MVISTKIEPNEQGEGREGVGHATRLLEVSRKWVYDPINFLLEEELMTGNFMHIL